MVNLDIGSQTFARAGGETANWALGGEGGADLTADAGLLNLAGVDRRWRRREDP